MQLTIDVPNYQSEKGFQFKWEAGFEINVNCSLDSIMIVANKAGLISLANHLLNLSQENIFNGYHIHLDQFNSLEEGSMPIVIQKK